MSGQKTAFNSLTVEHISATELAEEAITAVLLSGATIGRIKVCVDKGLFAVRPRVLKFCIRFMSVALSVKRICSY